MKLRVGKYTEIGITGERHYTEQDRNFALIGFGWEWARECYAYLSIYFLMWRIEFYSDYQKLEHKFERDYLDDLSDVAKSVDKVFNKMTVEEV